MSAEPRIRLLSKEQVAEGTMAFTFTKPPGFAFVAGQYAEFTTPPSSGSWAGWTRGPTC